MYLEVLTVSIMYIMSVIAPFLSLFYGGYPEFSSFSFPSHIQSALSFLE